MNPTLKNILIISAKNAVNAVLTNSALMAMMSETFNLHSWDGVKHILMAAGSVIGSREAMIWIPKLLRWSTNDSMPNGSDNQSKSASAGS